MPDERPSKEQRSTVDVTVDPHTMLQIRNDLREKLKRHYYFLLMVARANRKVGNLDQAHKHENEAYKTQLMIWSLDDPMEALTSPPPPEYGIGREE